MLASIRVKLYLLYAVVFAMGALLSWVTQERSAAVLESAMPLAMRDIPSLRALAQLKGEVAGREPIVYEYYAGVDRERFVARLSANQARIASALDELRRHFPDHPRLQTVIARHQLARNVLDRFDAAIMQPRPDREHLQALLAEVAESSVAISAALDGLADELLAEAAARGAETQRRVEAIVRLVVLFSLLLFGAALLVGFYFRAYLQEALERRRLAMFPERNPNPVLRLDAGGRIVYANPGCDAMARAFGVDCAALLPADLPRRLATLAEAGEPQAYWQYAVGERELGCGIHHLADFGMFHVYLTDITERQRALRQLEFQARHDVLTGLPNRRAFEAGLAAALAGGARGALLLLKLDRFRVVIDSLGHAAGDQALRAVAERLRVALVAAAPWCPGASAHRFDGDVFAVLLPCIDRPGQPQLLAERLLAALVPSLRVDGRELFLTFSAGVAAFPDDGDDASNLLRNADAALQAVREHGGAGVRAYDRALNARALDRLELEQDMRQAVARGELLLHYQPQLDIASGRVVGVEALLRWQHPARGPVSPADFIPLAEASGAILEIGAWVLAEACARAVAWQRAGLPPLLMAVNLSARQFLAPDLPGQVARVLAESGLAAEWLELEVTEGAAMRDVEAAVATLRALRDLGVRLAIDDFGTGYSSLAYLKRFPIDKLKIDQGFVRDMVDDADDAAITRAVIDLGHNLRLRVIAEGVETPEHLRRLRDFGCDEIQGYLFSRPLPAESLADLLASGRTLARA